MTKGVITLRILLFAATIFIVIHFIRIDFIEGTIPINAEIVEQDQCKEVKETFSIPITSIEGDTIESLFALYPDPELGFIDRLEKFYALNPHLKLQAIVSGDKILLPIPHLEQKKCIDTVS